VITLSVPASTACLLDKLCLFFDSPAYHTRLMCNVAEDPAFTLKPEVSKSQCHWHADRWSFFFFWGSRHTPKVHYSWSSVASVEHHISLAYRQMIMTYRAVWGSWLQRRQNGWLVLQSSSGEWLHQPLAMRALYTIEDFTIIQVIVRAAFLLLALMQWW
jgi:hypothetical protein